MRIDRVAPQLEIRAPQLAGWISKEVKVRPQKLDRLVRAVRRQDLLRRHGKIPGQGGPEGARLGVRIPVELNVRERLSKLPGHGSPQSFPQREGTLVRIQLDQAAARRGPRTGVVRAQGLHLGTDHGAKVEAHTSSIRIVIARACASSPSRAANRVIGSFQRASAAGVRLRSEERVWKSSTESGELKRAVPPVGKT